ncbi:hypothetical protein ID866_10281 [Astraeus odoratus]|nr:hypothetical protein ID866_10281 [Astraeus odoratus]
MASLCGSSQHQPIATPEEDLVGPDLDTGEPALSYDPPTSDSSMDIRISWTYFFLGCAVLLPWNALINATSFFMSRLAGTPMRATFSSYQSSVFTVTGLVAQAYSTVTSKQSSPSRRVFGSTVIVTFFMSLLFLSTIIQIDSSSFFSFVLFSSFFMSAARSYLATAVYAGAALLGGSCMQATMSGQAAVAVAVSIVELISTSVSVWRASSGSLVAFAVDSSVREGRTEELAARMFFGISVVFMAFIFAAYVWLIKQPLYEARVGLLELDHRKPYADNAEECRPLLSDSATSSPMSSSPSDVWRVFKANFIFLFSAAYVFAVTLTIFPSTTITVLPISSSVNPLIFVSTHFLAFNGGDLLGRYICSFPRMIVWSAHKILTMALLRTLFIPIILLCNIQRPSTEFPAPPVLSSDVLYMLILIALGISNGYVSTLCFLVVSSTEHNHRLKGHEDIDIAATLAGFVVAVGLAMGSLFSFGVRAAIGL